MREIKRVLVIGRRLGDLQALASPVVSIDRERIARSGATTVAELLTDLSQQSDGYAPGARASGAQFAELRGLGPEMTLVLINGRRTWPSASTIKAAAFDLNTLPITAIERVEVSSIPPRRAMARILPACAAEGPRAQRAPVLIAPPRRYHASHGE